MEGFPAMALHLVRPPLAGDPDTATGDWSARYAATLHAHLAQIAPDLAATIGSDAIGVTITGDGWAIHAVSSAPHGERYLSLMAMRGMGDASFELAIRDLCLAMNADQRHHLEEPAVDE
jgi:hypothetical protein